ncbi:MAG: hypothetical protein HYX68_00950 [Planctomycetes bacterium]|jgi:hypothetical protein|nr:hypothetical protein [Planctomycetota bacterium]
MSEDPVEFNRGAIHPMQCLREGWQLIREQYWLFVGIVFVGGFIAGLGPMGILIGPMFCGFFLCLFRREHGQEADFSLLFKGFDYFIPGLVPSLAMTIPALFMVMGAVAIYMILLFSALAVEVNQQQQGGQPNPAFILGPMGVYFGLILLIVFISQAINMFLLFSFPLIVERQMSGWNAVKLSVRAALGNLGGLIGLFILLVLLRLASSLLCFVGQILEAPLQIAALAIAYRQVFPPPQRFSHAGLNDADDDRDFSGSRPAPGESPSTEIRSEEP